MKYQIENLYSGHVFGIYEGGSKKEALDALARDAGYEDYEDMCEVAPVRPGEISVKEVSLEVVSTEIIDFHDQIWTIGLGACTTSVLAQLWDENGAYRYADTDAGMMHYGVKAVEDAAVGWNHSTSMQIFLENTGVTEEEMKQFLENYIDHNF